MQKGYNEVSKDEFLLIKPQFEKLRTERKVLVTNKPDQSSSNLGKTAEGKVDPKAKEAEI